MTEEERARLEAAEREALKMLHRRMREGRRYPRRHQQVVFLIILCLVALAFVVALVADGLRVLFG
jgi:hypothetical protein